MEVSSTTPKKRILYVITKANWGGAQRYVFDLAISSREAGYDVAVAYGVPGQLSEALEAAHIRTVRIPGMERDVRLGSDARAFFSLIKILKDESPDIVHINSSKAGAIGALAARIAFVPYSIFTAHAWAFNENRPSWQKIVFKIAHAATVILSDVTICVSESTRRDMAFVPGARRKLVVIRNGVRETSYRPRDEARKALWPEGPEGTWIGMLSELHPTKRIDDAIDTIIEVRKTYPAAKLVVLGEGQERERLEKRIETENLSDTVRLAGFMPEGSSYLRAFDIFLHTSRTDALAYAVIEAGLAGLPVVATNVGGIPEVVEDGKSGLLCPPLETEQLAVALKKLIANPEHGIKLGRALQARIKEYFSVERMITETQKIYRKKS